MKKEEKEKDEFVIDSKSWNEKWIDIDKEFQDLEKDEKEEAKKWVEEKKKKQ
jgi:hypothetical protein